MLNSVHPHMRGEYVEPMQGKVACAGTPPHAWGIRAVSTHARKSDTVHPHMRGEYGRRRGSFNRGIGTPPHAWGIRSRYNGYVRPIRYTPTCVGNTPSSPFTALFYSVHPHMRGEYAVIRSRAVWLSGTPPHAWGIRRLHTGIKRQRRYTPTCVGNTTSNTGIILFITVHPHMRGEYSEFL